MRRSKIFRKKTNDNELCKYVLRILAHPDYEPIISIHKMILTEHSYYKNVGFTLLKTYKDKSLVSQRFSIKLSTLSEIILFLNSIK